MAQRKPNKRIQKKQTQNQQRQKLIESGQNKKAVKNLEKTALSKEYKKVQTKEKHQERRAYLETQGVPKSIISQKQLYRRSDSFLHDKENLKQWRKEGRELDRFRKLKKAGYKESEIKKSWLRYDKITNQKIWELKENTVYKNDYYICIQYVDIRGDSVINPDMFTEYTLPEMKKLIHDMVEEASLEPDDSSFFSGAFRIVTGSDYNELLHTARKFEEHGYNIRVGKFSRNRYNTLTVRNDWSPREYAEMTLLVLYHSKNSDVLINYEILKDYATTSNSDAIKDIFR